MLKLIEIIDDFFEKDVAKWNCRHCTHYNFDELLSTPASPVGDCNMMEKENALAHISCYATTKCPSENGMLFIVRPDEFFCAMWEEKA